MSDEQKTMYKITITKTRLENTIKSRTWEEGGTESKSECGKFGYTPQVTEVKDVAREIYSQVVEDLDVGAVIYAVNHGEIKTESAMMAPDRR